jgi:hypothetical protein
MSYSNKRKNKTMAAKNTSGNPEENDKENEKEINMEFEFIEESEIESVKRGRKAIVIPELVAFLSKAKVGQTVRVAMFALDNEIVTLEDKKTAKAKNSATLRAQAKASGWAKVAIIWDVNNVPFLKKIS